MVGDHIAEIDDLELVLVGSNLPHVWQTHKCKGRKITEGTIQFHKDLFDEKFLRRNQMSFIRNLLERSAKGILFSRTTAEQLKSRLLALGQKQGFDKNITLTEVSKLVNMTDVSFSRFFKAKTGITFIDSLLELRLGHASRLLIDTTESVSEIAYDCGFNNISNFNRLFKKKKNCTPKEFRESYSTDNRVFI